MKFIATRKISKATDDIAAIKQQRDSDRSKIELRQKQLMTLLQSIDQITQPVL